MTVAEDQREAEETPERNLTLHDLELKLQRRAARKIRNALAIGALLIEGYRPGEIRQALGLTERDYVRAHRWLQDALEEDLPTRTPPR